MNTAVSRTEERALVHEARLAEIRATINEIVDPCSTAMTHPIGIVDLGLVDVARVDQGRVDIELLPTSPHCLFVGLFVDEIETRVGALPWVSSVHVTADDGATIWDESRIAPATRRRLARHRAAAAARLAAAAQPLNPQQGRPR